MRLRLSLLLHLLASAALVGSSTEQCAASPPEAAPPPASEETRLTSEPVAGSWIVRFTSYKKADVHRCVAALSRLRPRAARRRVVDRRSPAAAAPAAAVARCGARTSAAPRPCSPVRRAALEAALGPSSAASGWSWVPRHNAAAAHPTDFALARHCAAAPRRLSLA